MLALQPVPGSRAIGRVGRRSYNSAVWHRWDSCAERDGSTLPDRQQRRRRAFLQTAEVYSRHKLRCHDRIRCFATIPSQLVRICCCCQARWIASFVFVTPEPLNPCAAVCAQPCKFPLLVPIEAAVKERCHHLAAPLVPRTQAVESVDDRCARTVEPS